jgi:hypothetical protein
LLFLFSLQPPAHKLVSDGKRVTDMISDSEHKCIAKEQSRTHCTDLISHVKEVEEHIEWMSISSNGQAKAALLLLLNSLAGR